jgi:hypothetical protein
MVEMIKKHSKKTMEAIWKEFDQMISKNVWTIPDNGNQLNQKKTIPSMMLVNEKVDEMGNIKIKARLVAGGNRQHCLYQNNSSPTVSIISIFLNILLAVSWCISQCKIK